MSSLTRMLGILDLFDTERPYLTSEEIMKITGFSRPTTFRYLKELRDSGLLARFAGGYVLGARAVRMDYIIRESDPMLKLFQPIAARLREEIDCDVVVTTLRGDEFLVSIHEETGDASAKWPRGKPLPVTRGAGALAVLSIVPKTQLRRLLADGPHGAELEKLKREIRQVARQGYATSRGALSEGNVGIAVPLQMEGIPPSSLLLIMNRKRFATSDLETILRLIYAARDEMTEAYMKFRSENADPDEDGDGPTVKPAGRSDS